MTINYHTKKKYLSHYEEGEPPVKVEEYYLQFFNKVIDMVVNCICNKFQQIHYIETLQTMKILPLKTLHEEDSSHELCSG